MASNSREARRRKILERGSDRLAFITGQINGVSSPPSSDSTSLSQSHLATDESLPDTIPPRDQTLTDEETTGALSLSQIPFPELFVPKFDFRVFAIASCFSRLLYRTERVLGDERLSDAINLTDVF